MLDLNLGVAQVLTFSFNNCSFFLCVCFFREVDKLFALLLAVFDFRFNFDDWSDDWCYCEW